MAEKTGCDSRQTKEVEPGQATETTGRKSAGDMSEASVKYKQVHVSSFTRELVKIQKETRPSPDRRTKSMEARVQMFHMMRQLEQMMDMHQVVVLTGGDGSGKTTTALFFTTYRDELDCPRFFFINSEDFPSAIIDIERGKAVYVVDNFLGHTFLDTADKWMNALSTLRKCRMNVNNKVHFLLITRTSVLQEALEFYGADLAFAVGKANIVTVSFNNQDMFHKLVQADMIPPDFTVIPEVGFPLCCSLASHLPEDVRNTLFENPRTSLLTMFRRLFNRDFIAKPACSYLAFSEDYISKVVLLESASVGFCGYSVQMVVIQKSIEEQMVAFYHHFPGLFVVEDDLVSFRNEAIREAALLALCESDADLVAERCSLRLLSRLAMIMGDEDEHRDSVEKPVLTKAARASFLRKMLEELESGNFRDTLTSQLLTHKTFLQEFRNALLAGNHLVTCLRRQDTAGLPFLFWAGACPTVMSELSKRLNKSKSNNIIMALIGCCYWGCEAEIQKLFQDLPTDTQAHVQHKTVGQILSDISTKLKWENVPCYPEDTLLTMAAWRGHCQVVSVLVQLGFPVNAQGHDGCTALMHLAFRGEEDVLRQLLMNEETDVCLTDKSNMTALHYAVYREEWPMPQELITAEVTNVPNDLLETPLEAACASAWSQGSIETLLLFSALPGKSEDDVLSWAFYHNKEGVASLLTHRFGSLSEEYAVFVLPKILSNPSAPSVCSELLNIDVMKTVLHERADGLFPQVSKWSNEHVVDMMLKSCHVDKTVIGKALLDAVGTGNVPVVKRLLREVPSFFEDNDNWTKGMEFANKGGSLESIEILFDSVDMSKKIEATKEAVHLALQHKHPRLAKFILDNFPEMEPRDENCNTILHMAAFGGMSVFLEWYLKEKPGDPDVRNESGCTPFMVACAMGQGSAAMILADHGADVTMKRLDGSSCLHLKAEMGDSSLVLTLLRMEPPLDRNARNDEGDTPLLIAFRLGHFGLLDVFGGDDRSLTATNKKGESCLGIAVKACNSELVAKLVRFLPDGINTRMANGDTPLLAACRRGTREFVQWLLGMGADVNLKDSQGKNCIGIAKQCNIPVYKLFISMQIRRKLPKSLTFGNPQQTARHRVPCVVRLIDLPTST